MLEPCAPLDDWLDENKATAAPPVSPPMTSRHACASSSSTPALPLRSPDGTLPSSLPRTDFTSSPPTRFPSPLPSLRRPASAPLPDMAIKPPHPDYSVHREDATNPKPTDGFFPVNKMPSSPIGMVKPAAVQDPVTQPIPDLARLSHLLRQAKYQKQRRLQTQRLFRRLQFVTSRTQRLLFASRHVRRTLAECVRAEDKHSFAHLFHTLHSACDQPATLSSAGLDSDLGTDSAEIRRDGFFSDISTVSRATIVQLLTLLQYDEHFVADRIVSLGQKELMALFSDGTTHRRADSVLGGAQRTSTRSAKPLGFVVDRVVDDVTAGSFRCPLEALVHLHNPAGRTSSAYSSSTGTWAGVSARLIAERKQGGERLISSLLDIWSFQSEWPGKSRLRIWMLHTLRHGHFLMDQPSRQSFRMRVQGQTDQSAEDAARNEVFYRESVDRLLDLLGDQDGASAIPDGALDLSSAIYAKLGSTPEHLDALPIFLATRWLFSSFLTNLITLPESHGLLNSHYVSDAARQKILGEIASRAYKVVFDVVHPWKNGVVSPAETVLRVQKVVARFNFSDADPERLSVLADDTHQRSEPLRFSAISASDVLSLMNSLFPARRPVSVSSDNDTLRSGLQSSASSVSGLSLFYPASVTRSAWNPTHPTLTTATSPGHLFGSFPQGQESLLYVAGLAGFDSDVADARTELEEYIAAHRSNDDTHWALLVSEDAPQRISTYNEMLEREKMTHTIPNLSLPANAQAKPTPVVQTAIETILCGVDESFTRKQQLHYLDVDNPIAFTDRLFHIFDRKISDCETKSDFVAAHSWTNHLEALERFVDLHGSESLVGVISGLEDTTEASIRTSLSIISQCDRWSGLVQPILHSAAAQVDEMLQSAKALRTKMWYTADVRTSSAYDSVRAVTSALRVMGKPKRLNGAKQTPPLRHWSGTRLSSQNIHLKSEMHFLELLGSSAERGGPNKLSDEQSRLTLTWMQRNDVQLICAGEERLHKVCMEIRKCVEQLVTSSRHDNPLVWSNVLFAQDLSNAPRQRLNAPELNRLPPRFDFLSLQTKLPTFGDDTSNASHTLSSASSRDYFERSPTLATSSSTAFWSPAATEIRSPSSTTSVASHIGRGFDYSPRKTAMAAPTQDQQGLDFLREQVTALLLSDVGTDLFTNGSETDASFFAGLGGELTERNLGSKATLESRNQPDAELKSEQARPSLRRSRRFDFQQAFASIFETFSVDCNPYTKLKYLDDIQRLLRPFMAHHRHTSSAMPDNVSNSLRSFAGKHTTPETDLLTEGFYTLFCQQKLRPRALFRDLQYIASLIPSTVLEASPHAQAFWNAALAALRLKSEASKKFVETADSIIDYQTNNRGHNRSASTVQQQRDSATFSAPPSRIPSAELMAHYTMADAALLLRITAREGDPAAQRELATLYLTHPELMDLIIAPFALPGEVFRDEIEGRWRRDRDPDRCDPRTMCVAHHWMLLGARGGDALAREFLRQREEMERLP